MPGRQRTVPITRDDPATSRLLDDSRQIFDRRNDPQDRLTARGARTKVVEAIGEYGTRRWVERTYGSRVVEVEVVRRGTRGAPVLDLVYDLEDGRGVVLEAKGPGGKLGTTQRMIFPADETGVVSRPVVRGRIEQFSPPWFEKRVTELRDRGQRRLANRLATYREQGRLEAAAVYIDAEGEVIRVDWRTEQWSRTGTDVSRPSPGVRATGRSTAGPAGGARGAAAPDAAPSPEAGPVRRAALPAAADVEVAAVPRRTPTPPRATLPERPTVRAGAWVSRARWLGVVAARLVAEVAVAVFFSWMLARLEKKRNAPIEAAFRSRLEARFDQLLRDPEVLRRLDQAPLTQQFWYEVTYLVETFVSAAEEELGRYRTLLKIQLVKVQIVDVPGQPTSRLRPSGYVPSYRPYHEIEEGVFFQPVFEELPTGVRLAADRYPARIVESSHYTPRQRLAILHDYVVFSRSLPELRDQYFAAMRDYRYELCAAGFRDLFTDDEIDLCRFEEECGRRNRLGAPSWSPTGAGPWAGGR